MFGGILRELSPNLIGLIILLFLAQVLFFYYGPRVLIPDISNSGLLLLNFVFAVLVPYNLAIVIKAIKLVREEIKKK